MIRDLGDKPAVVVAGLVRAYGDRVVLDRLDLRIARRVRRSARRERLRQDYLTGRLG